MFTKILYINLERRTDRKKHIENQIQKIEWIGEVERINAVDGRTLDLNTVTSLLSARAYIEANDNTPREFAPGSVMTRGAVGCALSHREAFINVLNGKHDKVLILEDDIEFDNDFQIKLFEYLKKIPNYDILYLGHHDARGSKKYNTILQTPGLNPEDVVFGLFGYVIDKQIASLLINMFPINGQIDSEIKRLYPYLRVFHLYDDLRLIKSQHSFTNNLGTDIQSIEAFENDCNNNGENEESENTEQVVKKSNNNQFKMELVQFILILLLLYILLSNYKGT